MSSDEWVWDEYHIIWGLRQGWGPKRRHFSGFASLFSHFYSPSHAVFYTKITSQAPGDYYMKMWWITMLKATDNPLLVRFAATMVKYRPNLGRRILRCCWRGPSIHCAWSQVSQFCGHPASQHPSCFLCFAFGPSQAHCWVWSDISLSTDWFSPSSSEWHRFSY